MMIYEFFMLLELGCNRFPGCQSKSKVVSNISGDSQMTLRHTDFFGLCVQLKLGLGYRLEDDQAVVRSNGLYM